MISQVNSVWIKKPLDPLRAPLQSASALLNLRVNSVPVPWENGDSRSPFSCLDSPFSWEYGNPSPHFLRPQVPLFYLLNICQVGVPGTFYVNILVHIVRDEGDSHTVTFWSLHCPCIRTSLAKSYYFSVRQQSLECTAVLVRVQSPNTDWHVGHPQHWPKVGLD